MCVRMIKEDADKSSVVNRDTMQCQSRCNYALVIVLIVNLSVNPYIYIRQSLYYSYTQDYNFNLIHKTHLCMYIIIIFIYELI